MLEINKTFFSIILQACFVYSQPASMFAVQADLWLIFYDVRWWRAGYLLGCESSPSRRVCFSTS